MSSRGVFLSMLSKMNVDVAKPLQDLQLELMGKGSLVYLEHKKLMMAQEAAHKKMMEEGMATHSAILKEIRNVESLDDSVYDEARRKRREQKVAASTSLGEASEKFSTVKYTGRKGIKPIKIRFSKKAAAIAQERDNLVMQRNLLALRQEEHKTARAVAELQQRNSDEIAKAKADKLELQLLLKQSEEALREIKVIESRAQEGHEQEISTFTADEEVAQKAHFKRIEEHTKIHLDTLAEIAKAPNLKKSLLKGIDTYFRVMVYALYGYIGYEVLSTMAEV
eukprot:TRINITY_DN21366_c2_g1_i1.p1 TRINITY_DN21366_c2_g1~~TRINITY_DN21366_c2_g1_i1.p1  ORF type:complete len:301 (+),score=86.25 TRINITY_DN21366_c2_g1_i1:64-903(+)